MNKILLESTGLKTLEMLREEAPNMKLARAYDFASEHQLMQNELEKYEFIIMMLLKAIGINDNGHLSDKDIALKLKDMPEEVWEAIDLAGRIHGGYACSISVAKDWVSIARKKINSDRDKSSKILEEKKRRLDVVLPESE